MIRLRASGSSGTVHLYNTYRAPSWVKYRLSDGGLRWRVTAFKETGDKLAETDWRKLRLMN